MAGHRLAILRADYSPASEAIRQLRLALFSRAHGEGPRSLLLAPVAEGSEASTLAAGLGASLARSGRQVVLVDADLRSPSLHSLLEAVNDSGFRNLLAAGSATAPPLQPTGVDRLRLLPAGPPMANPGSLLDAADVPRILGALQTDDAVLIAVTSPTRTYADAAMLAPNFDATILVVTPGVSRRADLERAHVTLGRTSAKIAGVALVER